MACRHKYDLPGEFQVMLTVEDNDGLKDTTNFTIIISQKPSTSGNNKIDQFNNNLNKTGNDNSTKPTTPDSTFETIVTVILLLVLIQRHHPHKI